MARRGRGTSSPTPKNKSFIHSGKEALNRVDDELAKQAQKKAAASQGNIFNFFMKPGDTKQYAVLDEEPSCFVYEHTLKDPRTGKYSIVKTCPKDSDNCPACEEVGDSTYVMKLSILDFTEYTDKHNKVHEFSRKLMTVKPTQQKKFLRRFAKEGTLRGAIFEASRDGPKDAAIGNDIEFVEFMSDEELENDYISTWEDKDGKTHTDNLADPFVYEDIIAPPDVEELRVLVGGAPAPGSRAHDEQAMNDNDDGWDEKEEEDDEPWDRDGEAEQEQQEDDKPTSRRRSRGSSSSRPSRNEKSVDNNKEDSGSSDKRSSRRSRRTRR